MLSRLLLAAIIGAIRLTSTSAQNSSYGFYGNQQSGSCYDLTGAPIYTKFPFYDGFHDIIPGSAQDKDIAERAGGTLPNFKPPNSVSDDTVISVRLNTQYEFYIVALFTQCLEYITEGRPGFAMPDSEERDYAMQQLTSQIAQSQQHVLGGLNFLQLYGQKPERPCRYQLPYFASNDYYSYLYAGALIMEVYLSCYLTIIQRLAQAGDIGYIASFAASHQNVAERVGLLRSLLGYTPSGNPFPAAISRESAYSTLVQLLIVPGSCPDGATIDLLVYDVLYLDQQPLQCGSVDQVIQLRVKSNNVEAFSKLYVSYVNQQNLPVVVPVQYPQVQDGCVSFSAVFPSSLPTFGRGRTSVGVVNQTGPFTSVTELVPITIFLPALVYRD